MSIQIQAKIKHIFGKIISLALLLFILVGFGLRTIGSNAQAGTPAPATPAAPKPKTPTPATPAVPTGNAPDKLDGRIGTVKECSVDTGSISKEDLKTDSSKANTFIFNCLKDVLRIVITISIILAIMKMMWVGIKHLNTFGEQVALTKELSETITGFVVGALILGLFATFIQVINPAALRIDKIFSPKVIDDYKCLNKGLTGASLPGGGCKDQGKSNSTANGSGTTTSGTGGASVDSIKTLLENPTTKAKTQTLLEECNTYYLSKSKSANDLCKPYQEYLVKNPTAITNVDAYISGTFSGLSYANGTFNITKIVDKLITANYTRSGSKKPKPVTLSYNTECLITPFTDTSIKIINAGDVLNYDNCKLTIN
jgi:hypothetical protein